MEARNVGASSLELIIEFLSGLQGSPHRCAGGMPTVVRRMVSGPLSRGLAAGGGGGPRLGCERRKI